MSALNKSLFIRKIEIFRSTDCLTLDYNRIFNYENYFCLYLLQDTFLVLWNLSRIRIIRPIYVPTWLLISTEEPWCKKQWYGYYNWRVSLMSYLEFKNILQSISNLNYPIFKIHYQMIIDEFHISWYISNLKKSCFIPYFHFIDLAFYGLYQI